MVQFGRTIQEALDGKFKTISENFVSYQKLKEIIKRIETLNGKDAQEDRDDYATNASEELVELLEGENTMELADRFFRILDADVERISSAAEEALQNGMEWQATLAEEKNPDAQKLILVEAFNKLQLLFEYCQLNSEGVRKIAKKFDRRCVEEKTEKTNQEKYIAKVAQCSFGRKDLIDEQYFAIVEEYANRFIDSAQPHMAVQDLEDARDKLLDGSAMQRLMTWVVQQVAPVMVYQKDVQETNEDPDYLLYFGNFTYICGLIYFFCVGLGLMSNSFKIMSGAQLNDIVSLADNPFVGLMVGIFATVMVQSSSTSTSIAVAMVGSGVLSLDSAIPMIMGANIGTSVTSTIVALGHMDNNVELKRAFSAATVHDMFNLMAVAILFPIEMITGMLQSFVGWLSGPLGGGGRGGKYTGPLKYITSPVLKMIASVDKKKLKDHAQGKEVSGSLMKSGLFASGGAFGGMTDGVAGFVMFVISIVLVCVCLVLLVKFLRYLVGAAAKSSIRTAFSQGALVNIFLGMLITVSVQSSSITTSTLVPLAATGLITLEQMFPIVLGANIGTTCTALLAALAVDKVQGLELALVHLCFNLTGILMLYPYEPIRQIPLNAARALGNEVQLRAWFAPVYLLCVFCIIPGICLALSAIGDVALAIGSFFLFGIIGTLIGMRYLYLNPGVVIMGLDHNFVRSLSGEPTKEIEMVDQDDVKVDEEAPQMAADHYRPKKYIPIQAL